MPRNPKIRWTKNQLAELRRDVRNFNAKRTRALKGDPDIVDFLPPKLSVKELKSSIKSAKELKNLTQYVQRGTRTKWELITTPGGVTELNFTLNELRRQITDIINPQRKKVSQSLKRKQRLGKTIEVAFEPKRFDIENIKKENWDKFVQSVTKQSSSDYWENRYNIFKESYLLAMFNELAGFPGYEELYEYVSSLSPQQIWAGTIMDAKTEIGYVYSHEQEAKLDAINEIYSAWKGIYG